MELIGSYDVEGYNEVYLFEFELSEINAELDINEFTQKQEGIDRLEWQTAWDEKYLDAKGMEIIGDWLNVPTDHIGKFRLTFFFHYFDFEKPLITPYGEIEIDKVESMPARLLSIIEYEPPN